MSYTPPIGNATTTAKGIIQLAGDLGGTATAPSVLKVNGISLSGTPATGQIITATSTSTANWANPAAPAAATAVSSGIVTLAGDLSGTATSPTVPGLAGKAATTTTVSGTNSISGGGDLSANRTLSLVNDSATPGNTMYYGTNGSGTKGYFTLPAGSAVATTSTTGTVTLAGDLGGTGASPSVLKVNGVAVSGTPSSGQVLTASSSSAAAWAAPAARPNVVSKTTTYTAAANDYVIADATTAFTVTLPTAASAGNGSMISVKKIDSSANAVTIVVSGGGSIDNVSSDAISTQWQSHDYLSNGTQWYLI